MVYEELAEENIIKDAEKIQEKIKKELGSRFFISNITHNRNFIKIQTPFMYLCMDFVYVYVQLPLLSKYYVTDLSETLSRSRVFRYSSNFNIICEEIKLNYNVNVEDLISWEDEDLCDGILKVSQASMLLENAGSLMDILEKRKKGK